MIYSKQDIEQLEVFSATAIQTNCISEQAHQQMINTLEHSLSEDKLLTILDLVNRLSISRMTVNRMIKRGDLDVIKIGKSVRIPESSLNRLIDSSKSGASK